MAARPAPAPEAHRDEGERRLIRSLSPRPPVARDTTNRLSGNMAAVAVGRALFFDVRLSRSERIACATCHDPATAWSSAARFMAQDDGSLQRRHAPSLLDAAQNRWFFWDGRRDTLWAQALEAMSADMRGDPDHLAAMLAAEPKLEAKLRALGPPSSDPGMLFVTAGKALAAFVETLATPETPFDRYVAAVEAGRPASADARLAAGLRVFLHEGQCIACHSGPLLTDGEFHSTRLPPPAGEAAEDAGRFVGLYLLASAPFSAGGEASDDPRGARARLTAIQARSRASWGTFKTPSLRNVRHRPRFMHDGRFASLSDVIDHYSATPGATSLAHGDPAPPALNLTPHQKSDLLAFLEAL